MSNLPISQTSSTTAPAPADLSPGVDRLVTRLRSATEWVGPGKYLISSQSAPTDAERQTLTLVADDLRAGMAAATRSELRTSLLKFLGPYTRNVSTDSLDEEVGMFVAALSGIPLWAVRQALLNWLQAKIPDCSSKFVPKPPELRQEAVRIVQTRRHALGSIDVVLSAEVQQTPSNEDREAAIAHWNEVVRPLLQQAEEVYRDNGHAEQTRVNQRVLDREIGPSSGSEKERMTMDLRQKLNQMTDERIVDPHSINHVQ